MQKDNGVVPFLERPNVKEINKDIEDSGLVLCLILSEKDSPSLTSPSNYLLHVHRYMYLSNIVPKCIEYFGSFVFPFYGNKFGVYFECIQGRRKRRSTPFPVHPNGKEHQETSPVTCPIINSSTCEVSSCGEDPNWRTEVDKPLQERILLDWRLPIGVLFDIYCDVEGEDWSFPSLEEQQTNWKRCTNGELFPDHVSVLEITPKEISDLLGEAEREQTEGEKHSSKFPLNDATKDSLTGEKPCSSDEGKTNVGEPLVKHYHMRMNKKINSDWYDQQFLSIADRNVPWKLVVHFKDEENYKAHFGRGGGTKVNYDGNINLLPYNTCIPLYRGFHDFEECLISQLKKANYVFNKNNRVLQMLPQQVENELLQNLKRFDVENICALYREHIDYNMVRFVDHFNAKCAQAQQNGHSGGTSGENNSVCALMKDENVVKEVPIIIHIYGPPYNQVLTKCPLFKIAPAEGTENTVDRFFAYTLGDFLHEQFPSFFRKIKKCGTEGGVADDPQAHRTNGEIGAEDHLPPDNAEADAVSATVAAVPSAPPDGESIFYFVEDDYLIFSPYMFIIINGIQIPLKTPLYWLAANFSQFDNFLHVILRVPPY
ncbi:Autophagy protein 5 [Plasmodium coatneyi]|uniref:Autophagy protein 5 n=1 Tax=Plasmodium coatneyi TaxID=208452 RepID=A0A1B1E656_9APIC|nr:Autophagy protein 5 [Plasmodium coatneyi]ANQ10514.1 Autophagy protein 5 [Plasmodium coatneyi]